MKDDAINKGQVLTIRDAIDIASTNYSPLETGVEGVDRVLGGGFFPRSLTILAGSPGAYKTTFFLVLLRALAVRGKKVLYVTGEESLEQLGRRARALGDCPSRMRMVNEQDIDNIFEKIEQEAPSLVVVDSINMVNCFSERTGDEFEAGSAASIKTALRQFNRFAKGNPVAFVVVAQSGRDSAIAARRLEYLVDVSLWLHVRKGVEQQRVVLGSTKNRFGARAQAEFAMKVRQKKDGHTEVTGMSEVPPSTGESL